MTVRTRIIRIGNSQGVRIPKLLLEQSGITDKVELEIKDGEIIIHAAEDPRRGWEQAFLVMAEQGDDTVLDPELPESDWDKEDWQW